MSDAIRGYSAIRPVFSAIEAGHGRRVNGDRPGCDAIVLTPVFGLGRPLIPKSALASGRKAAAGARPLPLLPGR